jgi:hypothetical protein
MRRQAPDQPSPFAAVAHDVSRRGLAVIPCPEGKSPKDAYRFRSWKRPPGQKFVDQMIRDHGDDNLGIITDLSKRKLTVIDGDDAGEQLHLELISRFGETPLATLTPSGGVHLWYRYNGERSANLRRSEVSPSRSRLRPAGKS